MRPGLGNTGVGLRGARGQRGLALVVVLWVLVLLSLIAASFTYTTRTEVNLTRNLIEAAKAEALADAGINRAILGLMDPDEATRWKADGRVYIFRLGGEGDEADAGANEVGPEGSEVRITIQDEIGKIDLNRAQDELLQSLFELAGLDPDEAAALVDAIVDFRDPDDLVRLNGAEDKDYAAAGLPWGAKDAPFEAVEELEQVLGMNLEIYRRVKPALSVFARRPGFNPHFAPAEVLLALPGIEEQDVSGFTERRSELRKQRDEEAGREVQEAPDEEAIFGARKKDEVDEEFQALEEEAALLSDERIKLINALSEHPDITRFFTPGKTRGLYEIEAVATADNGAVFVRQAVIQLMSQAPLVDRTADAPFVIHAWTRGQRPEADQ
jgi:general secretion pathway protein K